MSNFIEYALEEGGSILIVDTQEETGAVKVSRGESVTIKARKKFEEVLKDVRVQSKLLLKELSSLDVNEAEVKFGISAVGELGGSMVIGKVGAGVNYEITLKWSKRELRK